MSDWELAQLNIATLRAPLDSPVLAGFVSELDRINALAEQSTGFVWRYQTEEGNACDAEHDFGENLIINMSVWRSVEDLHNFTYCTAHVEIMRRRKEWFQKMLKDTYSVLWWIPQGHETTLREAQARLELLKSNGSTPEAFTFKKAHAKPFDV